MNARIVCSIVTAIVLAAGAPVWAEKASGDYGHGMGMGEHGYGRHDGMMRHGGTGQFIRYVLKNQKEIGLSDEQATKLKAIHLEFDKTRIKMEADVMVAEREAQALIQDDKSDLGAIEAKIKQSEDLEVQLRMAAIKAKREAKAVLTAEQMEKLRAEHEKAVKERRMEKGPKAKPGDKK